MGVAMDQPHRRWLPESARRDQRAESALGRLYLAGLITQPECWAGERFRSILREFHVVLATPVTASGAAVMVAETVQPDAEGDTMAAEHPESDEERRDRVLAAFGFATMVLRGQENHRAVIGDIEALLMRDQVPDNLGPIKCGLSALAAKWRMEEPAEEEQHRPVRVRGARSGAIPTWDHEEREISVVYQ